MVLYEASFAATDWDVDFFLWCNIPTGA